MDLKNWTLFPKRIELPIIGCNLYEYYGLQPPNSNLIDNAMRKRLAPYLLAEGYILNYAELKRKNIILYVSISPKLNSGWNRDYALFRAALEIAAEESTGTWDPDLKTILPEEMDENSKQNMQILEAKVIGLNIETGMAAIAYPVEGFEFGNLPQMLSIVVGNYTGMSSVAWGVRFEDMDIPDIYADSFIGPSLGNDGIKAILGDRMTVGTIVKPKTGLSAADWAKTAERSFLHGLDVVKDDENLTSQEYCDFDNRAKLVLEAMQRVKAATGRELVFVANITAGTMDEMIRRADLIQSLGGNCLMIDILAAGMTAVQTIRAKYPNMILHGHRAGHGAQTIFPEIIIDGHPLDLRHGVSMKAWTLIARLAGIDQFHIGAPEGKMEASHRTVLENLEACTRPLGKLKTMKPICSGGLKATVLWEVARIMNPVDDSPNLDIICQAGGGTHSHDLGTAGGSKSMVQARDAIGAGISPEETMAKHFETLLAFRKWDNVIYGKWVAKLTMQDKICVTPDERPYKWGNMTENAPKLHKIEDAVKLWPPFRDDLLKFNPELLSFK